MTNEEIFKKLEAFAENRRDDCSKNGETHNTQYWVGYLDGLRRLYEKITDKEVTKVTTNFEKIKSMTLEEMAELLKNSSNNLCLKLNGEYITNEIISIKDWLEREVEE